ncbi:TPA: recombination protein RecR [Candidatus Daviesbacteria bacterium]|uniref:Recombination protein RecR n=1 Tax=Candidatus Daviesbacteria bacterium GW2011_GWF2_38_6 TaxID=1618432 RepID=A0A0G0MZG2_9BACT|nr:MAG: Recombination protein RecR [Candidatus Daviesbacteria bacterium GW2011_GWA2_38_17]KKQ79019.1 MAG: Recombination protein RecR [Candidatus Daviesbacteria bacterium GW2011_GWF2_38_6]OGE26074.1 MAG: recombination protein RecR [Candidatus Daviesbacteria bacterium RIFCSPHIGHO2_02_FULL_39_41]OGE44886.1 MAG: recombination protein RecR [Candidatus Daviesbacteria bacterium RIFCSPHIGHO2_12_FULL_38_25]OGE68093.1 MAG: recombination protein RecR [Candidatus Daviesbacteria bacterium RIFCSPLOWO2_02_FUL
MQVPKSIQSLIEAFERLPGIGPKTAQRLTYYLLHAPKEESQALADAAVGMKEKTKICSICFNIGEEDTCQICSDQNRETSIIAIVEDPLDVLALEKSNYKGLYHVLHGVISPLENIGPDEIHIRELLPRLKDGKTKEIILATNPTMEGEATAMYIQRLISPLGVKITRIARGLPVGSDLEYADESTLSRALEGRKEY